MESEEESGGSFTVRDRRRFLSEETSADAPQAEAAAAAPAPATVEAQTGPPEELLENEEDDDLGIPGDGSLPDIYAVLAMFLGELRSLAWLRMGLVANPGTGQIERDMPQAKVAIDTVAFLAQQLEPTVPAEDRLPLRALVSDLQMNYVEQTKRG